MARYRLTKEGWINLDTGLPETPPSKADSWKTPGGRLNFYNNDKLLDNGVRSPVDGRVYSNKKTWRDNLKAHGCVEVGNDLNNAKPRSEIRGDYNVRQELARATYEVLNKQGR